MAFICFTSETAAKMKEALKGKEVKMTDLIQMSTEARFKLFEKYAGTEAHQMNLLFEEKVVLKNKVVGLKNWISKVTQEGRYSPETLAELKKAAENFRAQQRERIFSPSEEQAFLNELADKLAGNHITKEQANTIFELTKKTSELQQIADSAGRSSFGEPLKPEELQYGAAKRVLEKYTNALKEGDATVKEMLKETYAQFKDQFKTNKPRAVYDLLVKSFKTITDNSIGLAASWDISFLGRQGLHTLETHPSIWKEAAYKSVKVFWDTLTKKGEDPMDAVWAREYANPLHEEHVQQKLVPTHEEQFPTSLPERAPVIGKVFKASENAFNAAAMMMRTGNYDLLRTMAEKNGVELTDAAKADYGKLAGAMTGRGDLGRTASTVTRVFLWAPKMIKANWDILTAHTGTARLETDFARKQAVYNLLKVYGTTVAVMTIANALKPGSAETDPRSTNFGKIKIGNTTFDYTGGAGALVVLAARQVTGATKSTSTGLVSPFGVGYKPQTRFSTVVDFVVGKTTPPVGAVIALMKGTTPTGQPATLANQAARIVTPIALQNAINLKDDHSANAVAGVLLDALGVNSNTYVAGAKDWSLSTGKELEAFHQKVGDQKFKAANDQFNKTYQDWLTQVRTNPRFQNLSDEDKQKVMVNKQGEIKDKIFRQYGFHYKPVKSKPLPKL